MYLCLIKTETEEDLSYSVNEDMQRIKEKYASLSQMIWTSIDNLDTTKAFLLDMGILSSEDRTAVHKATCINEIRMKLSQKYWSFLDCNNLKAFVMNNCNEDVQREFDKYHEQLRNFCKRRSVGDFSHNELENPTDRSGMGCLIVMLNLSDPALTFIKIIKHALARIIGCSPSQLTLQDIKLGSVEITFLMTVSQGKELFDGKTLSANQQNSLVEEQVVRMKYESSIIFDSNNKGLLDNKLN